MNDMELFIHDHMNSYFVRDIILSSLLTMYINPHHVPSKKIYLVSCIQEKET